MPPKRKTSAPTRNATISKRRAKHAARASKTATMRLAPVRVRLKGAHIAEFEAKLAQSNPDLYAQYTAIPKGERRGRLTRAVQSFVDEKLQDIENERRELDRERRAILAERADAGAEHFQATLELIDHWRDFAVQIKRAVLDEPHEDVASMQRLLRVVDDADAVIHELNVAKARAVAARKALDGAKALWDRGVAAACSRHLAAHLRTDGRDGAIERVSENLRKPADDLRGWLARHEGDLAKDGPKVIADRAIAALGGHHEKTVRRWRLDEHGATLFDRVIEILGHHDPEELSESPESFLGSLGASGGPPLGLALLGAAPARKNKP